MRKLFLKLHLDENNFKQMLNVGEKYLINIYEESIFFIKFNQSALFRGDM